MIITKAAVRQVHQNSTAFTAATTTEKPAQVEDASDLKEWDIVRQRQHTTITEQPAQVERASDLTEWYTVKQQSAQV